MDKTDSRYPYTYAADYLRKKVPNVDGTILSRAVMAQVCQVIADAMSMENKLPISEALANKFIEDNTKGPNMSEANCSASACSVDDLSNGLRHIADDHSCYTPTLIAAADAIDQMAEALDGLSQPLGRMDYTVEQLDEVVRRIASEALNFKQNKNDPQREFGGS